MLPQSPPGRDLFRKVHPLWLAFASIRGYPFQGHAILQGLDGLFPATNKGATMPGKQQYLAGAVQDDLFSPTFSVFFVM